MKQVNERKKPTACPVDLDEGSDKFGLVGSDEVAKEVSDESGDANAGRGPGHRRAGPRLVA